MIELETNEKMDPGEHYPQNGTDLYLTILQTRTCLLTLSFF